MTTNKKELLNKISDGINKDIKGKVRNIYEDGYAEGMYVGIAVGRFYEQHNIDAQGGIPHELCDEFNKMYAAATKEYYAHPRTESLEGGEVG